MYIILLLYVFSLTRGLDKFVIMETVRLIDFNLVSFVKGTAILLYRGISYWWNGQTAEEKELYRKKAEENRNVVWYCSAGAAGLGVTFGLFHYRPVVLTMITEYELRKALIKFLLANEWTAVFLSGLGRLWWFLQSPAEKQSYQNRARVHKNLIWCAGTAIGTGLCVFALTPPFLSAELSVDSLLKVIFLKTGFIKMMTVFSGEAMQWWWWQQTADTKQWYRDFVNDNKQVIKYGCTFGLAAFQVVSMWCLETDPSTGRTRLFIYRDAMFREIGDVFVNSGCMEFLTGRVLDTTDAAHGRVARVFADLLAANPQARGGHNWAMDVVDYSPANAFAVCNDHLYVSTGMLRPDSVANDDQLSVVVAHEMAHCLQRHVNQKKSVDFVMNALSLIPIAAIWATQPYVDALFTHYYVDLAKHLFVLLPYSRFLEAEADRDGLMLAAANPCMDVVEGYRYFNAMVDSDFVTTGNDRLDYVLNKVLDLFSTHPISKDRAECLYSLIPAAKELQKSRGNC